MRQKCVRNGANLLTWRKEWLWNNNWNGFLAMWLTVDKLFVLTDFEKLHSQCHAVLKLRMQCWKIQYLVLLCNPRVTYAVLDVYAALESHMHCLTFVSNNWAMMCMQCLSNKHSRYFAYAVLDAVLKSYKQLVYTMITAHAVLKLHIHFKVLLEQSLSCNRSC
jgi:hypothetical protein